MQPHQQRVVKEKAELDDRAHKLSLFFRTEMFEGLPTAERDRLRTQLHLMRALSSVLEARINAFT